jgi:ABC-2 type transport system ATP-binding protein
MTQAFELRNVTKRYGKKVALDDVTVAVPRGSIVGLVGRNGSGKTTLLRHVTGLVLPDSGSCTTLGTPSDRLGAEELSRIGWAQQHARFLPYMRVHALFEYVASFHSGWDRALERELVAALEIEGDARVGTLSPGLVQRISLVVATCHRPELLLLDEPLSDLDPHGRKAVLRLLLDRFNESRMTIVVSSHLLHDIEPVVDRILCVDAGRIVADAPLDALKEAHGRDLDGLFTLLVEGAAAETASGRSG